MNLIYEDKIKTITRTRYCKKPHSPRGIARENRIMIFFQRGPLKIEIQKVVKAVKNINKQ